MNEHPHGSADPSGLDGIPAAAADPTTTPIDYIVVGSGPGGAPLACRLAEAGFTVLVLEAGLDPGVPPTSDPTPNPTQRTRENAHPAYHCPGLHGSSTEPHLYPGTNSPNCAWGFDVKHYSSPTVPPAYYPRASALGGCAAHNAMISIYGVANDWQRIADLTGDGSWAPGRMRAIYKRIECDQSDRYFTKIGRWWNRVLNFVDPARNASSERGHYGWLQVSTSKPDLLLQDSSLLRLVSLTMIYEDKISGPRKLLRLVKLMLQGRLYRNFDLNDADRMRDNPEGIALIPMAVTTDGVRNGPRELLLRTRARAHSGHRSVRGRVLVATGVLARRIVFRSTDDPTPRAIGIEYQRGVNRYGASLPKDVRPSDAPIERCFARREIILSGGAFNSPQLLQLSGIGEPASLRAAGVTGLTFAHSSPNAPARFVALPGVGRNLRDRCEISVITRMKSDFTMLRGALFDPAASPATDPVLKSWALRREGIYTTNGATLGILKRSSTSIVQPDLFILGFPAAFRGYYPGWSKDLFRATRGAAGPLDYNLWSWVILKAYTRSAGTVTLQSADPTVPPDIATRYFNDHAPGTPGSLGHPDMDALVSGVRFIRKLNMGAAALIEDEVQPGKAISDDSEALRKWIGEQTWGHHACGTCRMGADRWQADLAKLTDSEAVLDSCLRVHGVRGLRVVDASVFPNIPGYFIATPVYMVSEKAADCILNELSV